MKQLEMEAGLAGVAPLDLALASLAKDGEDGQREQRRALRRPAAERWSCGEAMAAGWIEEAGKKIRKLV